MLVSKSTLAHLRFVFSIFLLPVYLFAYSQINAVPAFRAVLVFVIWYVLAIPATNGYNSYFDKDEGSIGLLEKPPAVDKSLYYVSVLMELLAFLLGLLISVWFAFAVLIYGIMSKLYSYPATRLKKYPIISFLTVFIFQGAFMYWAIYSGLAGPVLLYLGWDSSVLIAGGICSCLIGASYPLTQIYQHEEDSKRGDHTLSLLLGYKGSFIFSGIIFAAGIVLSFFYWHNLGEMKNFYVFLACSFPIFLFFNYWFFGVIKTVSAANYKNAMRMNFISAAFMLLYFGWLVYQH
ncbi:MAG: UbiA family prenyltransferase [Janthinobacterium lividum]